MGDIVKRVEAIMSEAVGSPVTMKDLNGSACADLMLYELAGQIAGHRETVRTRTASIIKDMQRVLDGGEASTLASSSDSRNHDAAVAALDALAKPLAMAANFYRTEHGLDGK
ncbi:hypothetical protein [Saccharothrix sp. HUAS TT1]|uniref:hypothetical protein n=1 Tax=unclassified Saccharothrix TaxID=2593673 RepID=UPI00345B945B